MENGEWEEEKHQNKVLSVWICEFYENKPQNISFVAFERGDDARPMIAWPILYLLFIPIFLFSFIRFNCI